ncbi:hypothetical protein ACIQU1_30645, partial [Streptomyces angustmyceticus]|uniref:hypothetical protein n=1 Tax=Streptomyces angustmyceticus TaxID=285578 RepID=UPI0037F34373
MRPLPRTLVFAPVTPGAPARAADCQPIHLDARGAARMTTAATGQDFKVADLSLAAFGRKEITL